MKKHSDNIFSENVVYSLDTKKQTEYDNLLWESVLLLQISGQMIFETSSEKITAQPGEVYLVRKHQFIKTTKTPTNNEEYKAVLFILKEDVLRKYALEKNLNIREKYRDRANLRLPESPYIQSFFNSLKPYLQDPKSIQDQLSILKVKEAVELLLSLNFDLTDFLFDFSQPHKADLEVFMSQNFKFNVPIEKFALLTGRSLASFKRDFKKTFNLPPRQWLQRTRLAAAHFEIEKNRKKPSTIYLELGFESLSHFHYAFKKQFGYTPRDIFNKHKTQ